jgi:diadenosine tetraphosphate (Ap4A) HIT family hydrolase
MYYDDFLKIPRDCPFCSPGRETITVVENKTAYLTYALAPYHPDHLLVIPKRHIVNIIDVTPDEEDDIYALVRKALVALHGEGYNDVSVLVRDGDNTMKTVSHLHYNIIPNTRLGDIDHEGRKRITLSDKEATAVLKKMKGLIH